MGIRLTCPNGHKLHVKSFLAGKRGICPHCGAKTLIPLEVETPQQAAATADLQQLAPVESSVTVAGTFTDAGSPSIVIAVADSPVATWQVAKAFSPAPPHVFPPSPPLHPSVAATPTIVTPLSAPVQPSVFPNVVETVSPAARYVARRDRNRRNQLMFAVMLFVAVVALAGVLVFVLQRGGSSPATNNKSVGSVEMTSLRQAVVFSDYRFDAPGVKVAN